MTESDSTKTCKKCEVTKPLFEFSKNKGTRDGFLSACKACRSAYDKQYYQRNAEKIQAYQEQALHQNLNTMLDIGSNRGV